MKASYLKELLPRLARQAGIEKRVHAHGLRHTHAYELMMEGVEIAVIQGNWAMSPSPPPAMRKREWLP